MDAVHPLRGRLLNALRSVAVSPGGLRLGAHPSSMPKLVEMGLVEERPVKPGMRQTGWFLTEKGRAAVREYGTGEPKT